MANNFLNVLVYRAYKYLDKPITFYNIVYINKRAQNAKGNRLFCSVLDGYSAVGSHFSHSVGKGFN